MLLKNDAAFAADAIERLAVDQDLPLVVVVQADQQAQQGRFTAATGADDGDELTVGDLQVEVADGFQLTAGHGEVFADLIETDQGRGDGVHARLQRVARNSRCCPKAPRSAPVRPTRSIPAMMMSMRSNCWAPIIRLPIPPPEGMKYSAPMVPSQA
ncbi:hypothetical protein D3C76_1458940 [compost metagenome]